METNTSSDRSELKQELIEKALERGDFTLASGKKSSFYLNCKHVTLSARGSYLSGMTLLEKIPKSCRAIGGLTLGADPLVSALTVLSHQHKKPLQGFLVRKEKKGHGTQNQIENVPEKGTKVAILDDVITTGGSALRAAEIALESGLIVEAALCLVDRKEGGEEAFSKLGIPLQAVFSIDELLGH